MLHIYIYKLYISYSCTFHPELVGFPDHTICMPKEQRTDVRLCGCLCVGKHALTPVAANPEKSSLNFFEHITTQAGPCRLQKQTNHTDMDPKARPWTKRGSKCHRVTESHGWFSPISWRMEKQTAAGSKWQSLSKIGTHSRNWHVKRTRR